jgi:hypothetical protein
MRKNARRGGSMKHTMCWFGNITFGTFTIGNDENTIAIVNSIDEKAIMNPDDADEYMVSQGYDSFLTLDEFQGDIVFSQDFLKGLTK